MFNHWSILLIFYLFCFQHLSTNGVLYLGVASVQLSQIGTTDNSVHLVSSSSPTHLNLYGRNYSIYSDTRWCNGVDELWKRIAVNSTKHDYNDPCLPPHYQWNVTSDELSSVCTDTLSEG